MPPISLPATAVLLLAAIAATGAAAAAVPQAETSHSAPGSSVRAKCSSGSASSGGGWTLLGALMDFLLGNDDDDDYEEKEGIDGSSDDQRTSSEEEEYSWLDLGLYDGSSSEEVARREPSLPDDVANSSLPRDRRATPSWSLGDIDVQAGKNWSVRVFNWMMVRRNPTTDGVEVKMIMPNLFSPGGYDAGGADTASSVASEGAGAVDVQGGKNWSVRIFDWLLVRRDPATDRVEVKMQVPGLYSSAGGDDYDDDGVSDRGRQARAASYATAAATSRDDGPWRRGSSNKDSEPEQAS